MTKALRSRSPALAKGSNLLGTQMPNNLGPLAGGKNEESFSAALGSLPYEIKDIQYINFLKDLMF